MRCLSFPKSVVLGKSLRKADLMLMGYGKIQNRRGKVKVAKILIEQDELFISCTSKHTIVCV